MVEIRDRIKEALKDRDMTAAELAKKSGIGKGSISKYINGLVIPKQSAIGSMARALGVSPAWLMGYDVDKDAGDKAQIIIDGILSGKFEKLNEPNKARLMAYCQALLDSQEDNNNANT